MPRSKSKNAVVTVVGRVGQGPRLNLSELKELKNGRNVVGKRFRKFRESAGLTQEDVEEKLASMGYNMGQTLIARVESGKRPIWDYEIVLFSKILNIPIWKLFSDRLG